MQKPPLMTCIYNELGYQLYIVNGVPTVWRNWTTRKRQKDGTWEITPHEETFTLASWNPETGVTAGDVRQSMVQELSDLSYLAR